MQRGRYIRNCDLHRDLHLDTVTEEIKKYAIRHHRRLHNHENQEMKQMLKLFVDSKEEKPTNYLSNYSKYY